MNFLSDLFGAKASGGSPAFVENYLRSCKDISKNKPLQDLHFVVFDTETTSLDLKEGKLLSLSAVSCVHNKISVSPVLDCFVAWEDNLELKNVEIHGITKKKSSSGMKPEEVVEAFLGYIQGAVLVAHHLSFDLAVVNSLLSKYHPKLKIRNPGLDTAKMALRLEQSRMSGSIINPKEYTLDALLERYQIEALERHTALGDAYSTALLFMKLVARLQKRGLKTIKDLM